MKKTFPTVALFALLAAQTFAAHAGSPAAPIAVMKAETTVMSDVVKLGDLIENAGGAASTPVFRAPELGGIGTVQVHRVIETAREHGILLVDTRGLNEVTVLRAARTIALSELEQAVSESALRELGLTNAADLSIRFDRNVRPLQVEPGAADAPRISQFSYDPRTRRFSGVVEVTGSTSLRRRLAHISGTLQETAEIVTVARPIARGETLRASDIFVERRPRAEIAGDVLMHPEAAIGQAARRALRANQALRPADLMKPDLVTRNDLVTILFENGGITLSARGKALESGAEGDVVNVMNPHSKRVLQATVAGAGLVTVGSRPALPATAAVTGSTR